MVLEAKNPPANVGDIRDVGGKIPLMRAWQPTPVFLPGESHGQRTLRDYSVQGCTESHTTEVTDHECIIRPNHFIPRSSQNRERKYAPS